MKDWNNDGRIDGDDFFIEYEGLYHSKAEGGILGYHGDDDGFGDNDDDDLDSIFVGGAGIDRSSRSNYKRKYSGKYPIKESGANKGQGTNSTSGTNPASGAETVREKTAGDLALEEMQNREMKFLKRGLVIGHILSALFFLEVMGTGLNIVSLVFVIALGVFLGFAIGGLQIGLYQDKQAKKKAAEKARRKAMREEYEKSREEREE